MRDIPVGNGRLLVNFDEQYQIRDIFFPHVGQENHTEGFPFRFGVWADGTFSWVFSDDWTRELKYLPETLVTSVVLTNAKLGIELACNDTVASHEDIFLRRVRIMDLTNSKRVIRVFLHQDFRIYENKIGDTAFFDPDTLAIVHYKKLRYFLINTEPHFDAFATGRKAFREQEGTWRDAEDGILHGSAITEGSVDSTIGLHFEIDAGAESEFFYWIAAGLSLAEVSGLDALVRARGPQKYLDYTDNYWRAWVNKNDSDLSGLPPEIVELLKRSLLVISTQIDSGGAILAANDSDVTLRATDHYSYLWTRDGALVANALDLAGYAHITRSFFDLCGRIVHPDGYFLQKYNADGTVASGWHAAWDNINKRSLTPIQEDETALVLWALWQHYDRYRDIEFAHRLYKRLVIPCANFMAGFRDPVLKLPNPSWNLWEDRKGIHTFTCSTVVAGLRAAGHFARLFAEIDRAEKFETAAAEIVDGMAEHLYSEKLGRFCRSLQIREDGSFDYDETIDASLFGTFYFECFDAADERVVNTMRAVEEALSTGSGIARFENDGYMRTDAAGPGNTWFICTLWLAEYYISRAADVSDLEPALRVLEFVASSALPSGVLAEQMDPATGGPVSVSPLTWSHSTFVAACLRYLVRSRELSTSSIGNV